MKALLKTILTKLYKIEIDGLDHYEKVGNRVLIVANHLSFLDAVLLAVFLPDKPLFAVNTFIAEKWWIKPFLTLVDAFPLDPTNPLATKSLIREIKKDKKCVIFPEGRITVTGSLMKIYEGPGLIAEKTEAQILPIRLDGAQYTPLSRLKGKVRLRLFPQITIRILEPRQFDIPEGVKGRDMRHVAGRHLYDLMTEMLFESSDYQRPLFQSLLDAKTVHGRKHPVVVDINRKPMNYGQLITRSFVLGDELERLTEKEERIGFLLPNMSASIVTFFALHYAGKIPAMLNFSTGAKNLLSACKTAELKTVITSRAFIEQGKLEELIAHLEKKKIRILYLEDIACKIGFADKTLSLLKGRFFPQLAYNRKPQPSAEDAAVILFTSGSEGEPKGVVLSHQNLQANRYQLSARIDFGPTDIVFNALPIFHSFGLTAGTLLPVLSGIKTFFYPSPLHYRIVPELVYDSNATIVFGTDTFLNGYARFANPYDFYAVRYVFAGAEKLKPETRKLWAEKYGVRIFEGYGATETAPVLATNTPMHNKAETVGRFMPGIEHKLEPVPGIEDGGKLFVRGANIMKGYFLPKKPGELVPPNEGWYDTGDIVDVDSEGFVSIKGRAKRFAKIAGEMVSLTMVEGEVTKIWPEEIHAVVSVPDAKKGEALVLLTTAKDATRETVQTAMKKAGHSEINIPKTIKIVDEIPLLGTGKTDYVSVQKIAEQS